MITALLVFLGGIVNAFMDMSSEDKMPNDKHNKSKSWKNKWKDGKKENGEKFLFSSTILVFLTDFWHLAQFIMLKLLFLAIVTYRPLMLPMLNYSAWYIDIITYMVVWGLGFQPTYSILQKIYDSKNSRGKDN